MIFRCWSDAFLVRFQGLNPLNRKEIPSWFCVEDNHFWRKNNRSLQLMDLNYCKIHINYNVVTSFPCQSKFGRESGPSGEAFEAFRVRERWIAEAHDGIPGRDVGADFRFTG
jgi:hypothetical protein